MAPPQRDNPSFAIKDHGHAKARAKTFQLNEAAEPAAKTPSTAESNVCSKKSRNYLLRSVLPLRMHWQYKVFLFLLALTAKRNDSQHPRRSQRSSQNQYVLHAEACFYFSIHLLLIFVHACFPYMCINHLHAWYSQSQKRTLDPLELELKTTDSCHLGAGNWIMVLCESSQCS